MEFIDLKYQQSLIRDQIRETIDKILNHGQFIMGPEIKTLEKELADYTDRRFCISCSSGTDALYMALLANDIGPGDLVFTTPFTFVATAEVISLIGATPIFVDINPDTFNIDPDSIRKCITYKTRALPRQSSAWIFLVYLQIMIN